MSMASDAKEVAILQMMNGFPSSSRIKDENVEAYLVAVEDVSPDAVRRSCAQFLSGKVPDHSNAFMPTAAELSANARAWDAAIGQLTADRELARLGTKIENGLLEMDFGHGMVDMRGLSTAEQDVIINNNGMIGGAMDRGHLVGGKNAALMSLEEKRAALRALPAPESDKTVPMPKLQRMTK
jgi:hypothetical protein